MIELREINEENWRESLHVTAEQKHYVADTTTILARAYAYRKSRSKTFLICDEETPVGMVLYHDCDDLEGYIFSELLIDERYQRKGYGRACVQLVLDAMRAEGKYSKVSLCYVEGNVAAKNLYQKFGFTETERYGDEIIMELEL